MWPPARTVTVVADAPDAEAEIGRCCAGLRHETVTFQAGDTTDRRTLDGLDLPAFDHVIILCYSDTLDAQQADARTLITLLHLRDIANRCGHCFSIVSEMLDIRNRNLAEVTQADDFIVSDRLVSLMLAQVSENKALNAVFADIFDPEGAEIYLKPATDYVTEGAAGQLLHRGRSGPAAGRNRLRLSAARRGRRQGAQLWRGRQPRQIRADHLRPRGSRDRAGGGINCTQNGLTVWPGATILNRVVWTVAFRGVIWMGKVLADSTIEYLTRADGQRTGVVLRWEDYQALRAYVPADPDMLVNLSEPELQVLANGMLSSAHQQRLSELLQHNRGDH